MDSDRKIISFFKKPKTPSSDHVDSSNPFDRLPDELLTLIFSYLKPINIENFHAFISLEAVSKRFRRCVNDNRTILENTTELVIGYPPDISADRCLCVIGPIALHFLLRRVDKITKVVINNDLWLRVGMMKHILPIVDRFVAKFQIREMIVADGVLNDELLIEKLVFCGIPWLETFHFSADYQQNYSEKLGRITDALKRCVFLRNLKIFTKETHILAPEFQPFFRPLVSLESLEIGGFDLFCIIVLHQYIFTFFPFQLRTLRFTHPDLDVFHLMIGARLRMLKELLALQNASSIRELEFHHCDGDDQLTILPHILDGVNYLAHFKLTFMSYPYVEFTETQSEKVFEFLANSIATKVEFMTISLTFQHTDVDRDAKLAIVHNLLNIFDVPHRQN